MNARDHILAEVVNWYEDSICFMVDTDTCMMEAMILMIKWVMPMGYKVYKDLFICYANKLLEQPVDTIVERFGTYKEKLLQVHSELE